MTVGPVSHSNNLSFFVLSFSKNFVGLDNYLQSILKKNETACVHFGYMNIWHCVLAQMEFVSFPKSHFG